MPEDSLSLDEIKSRIDDILGKVTPKTDHASLLEEVLTAFRQEGPLESAETEASPIGEDAAWPTEQEAGEEDE